MGEQEPQFIDPEFQTSGNEKIDFKSILMRRIETISLFRAHDMGEFSMFEFKADLFSDEHFNKIIYNINMYQNSVKALHGLLTTYRDEEYNRNIKQIKTKYAKSMTKIIEKKKQQTIKYNNGKLPFKDFEKWKNHKKKELTLKYSPKIYDEIYEECMALAKRAKFLGGDDTITVMYD